VLVSSLIAAIAVATARETFRLTLAEIDEVAQPITAGTRFNDAARRPVGAGSAR
jgi:hypothetical protein